MRLLGQYHQIEERMKSLSRANQIDELRNLLNTELLSNSEQVNAVLTRLLDINNDDANATNQQAKDQYDTAFDLVVGLLVVATALTVLFAWLLTRSITLPIARALEAAEEVAEGNLTRPITVDGNDEAGRLLAAMAKMQNKLRDTLQRIAGSATQLASAAEAERRHRRKRPWPDPAKQRNRTSRHRRQRDDQRRRRSRTQCREHFRSLAQRHHLCR